MSDKARTYEGRISGTNGTIRIFDQNAHVELNVDTILVESPAVVSVCLATRDGEEINLLEAPYLWTNLSAGVPYVVPMGAIITDITLDSGEIACY